VFGQLAPGAFHPLAIYQQVPPVFAGVCGRFVPGFLLAAPTVVQEQPAMMPVVTGAGEAPLEGNEADSA
jgi:hypothetical protein